MRSVVGLTCGARDMVRRSAVRCVVKWYGAVVWCTVVWCGAVWCGVVQYGVVWCGVVRYDAVWCLPAGAVRGTGQGGLVCGLCVGCCVGGTCQQGDTLRVPRSLGDLQRSALQYRQPKSHPRQPTLRTGVQVRSCSKQGLYAIRTICHCGKHQGCDTVLVGSINGSVIVQQHVHAAHMSGHARLMQGRRAIPISPVRSDSRLEQARKFTGSAVPCCYIHRLSRPDLTLLARRARGIAKPHKAISARRKEEGNDAAGLGA